MQIESLFRYKCNYPFISGKYGASDLNWSFKSQLTKFIKRFFVDPYKMEEKEWFEQWTTENNINVIEKFRALRDALK